MQNKNFFEIFEIPQTYNINEKQLEERFFALQKQYHPDSSNIENNIISSQINISYQTLLNKTKRAAYIINLWYGVDVLQEKTIQNPTILMDILQIQENFDDARNNKDLLRDITAKIENKRQTLIQNLGVLLDKKNDETKHEAINEATMLIFIDKIINK